MTPAEALWAATAGGRGRPGPHRYRRPHPGNRAEAAMLEAPSFHHVAYRPGTPIAHALDLHGAG